MTSSLTEMPAVCDVSGTHTRGSATLTVQIALEKGAQLFVLFSEYLELVLNGELVKQPLPYTSS